MSEYKVEDALQIIIENDLGREVFMSLFRDAEFVAHNLTEDDCAEVFEGILKGKDDLTKERLKSLCASYDTDLAEVLAERAEAKAEVKKLYNSKRYSGRVFRFRKEFGVRVTDLKYFMQLQQDGEDRWVEIDGSLFVDLRAMTEADKHFTTTRGSNAWEIEVKTDARRERMFTTIAKHCYGLEV